MLVVEGYKMFDGEATIRFVEQEITVAGVFLYRPDKDMWFVAPCRDYPWGSSFRREEVVEIREGGKVIWTSSAS